MRSFKVVFLGSANVGKTALVQRIVINRFAPSMEPTIGAAFCSISVTRPDREVRLDIWDTAGQERYSSLASVYYRGADLALVVYDLADGESYGQALAWVAKLKQEALVHCIICLIGTKSDLISPDEYGGQPQFSRATPREVVDAYVQENGLIYYETSSKTGAGVKEMLGDLADRCPRLEDFDRRKNRTVDLSAPTGGEKGSKQRCC